MKEHGTYLVPTLVAPRCIVEKGVEAGIADYMVKKLFMLKMLMLKALKKLMHKALKLLWVQMVELHSTTTTTQPMNLN